MAHCGGIMYYTIILILSIIRLVNNLNTIIARVNTLILQDSASVCYVLQVHGGCPMSMDQGFI